MTVQPVAPIASSRPPAVQTFVASAISLTALLAAAACGGSSTADAPGTLDAGSRQEAGSKPTKPVTSNRDAGSSANRGKHDSGTLGADDSGAIGVHDAGTAPEDAARDVRADVDHGSPSATYPAFAVDVAQVVDNGGAVLPAAQIVTITWSTDTEADTWNTFGDTLGSSPYWAAINAEYGVGPATSGAANHVSITTAPPASFSDSDLDTFVSAHAGVDWPASTPNTIYAVYLPSTTGLTLEGSDACAEGVGGYHDETQDSNHFVYAILPHCSFFQAADIELSASHEFNEAATDPHPETALAYQGFDQNHLAFEFFNQFQDELGDACESFVEATDAVDFTPYTVQRQWSNASAAKGSHWCLPALNEPFYNTTFLPQTTLDDISVDLGVIGGPIVQSKGFKVPLNTSRTFAIGYFSDVATSGPFALDVQGLDEPITQDMNGNAINNGTSTASIDVTSGVNGDIAYVTVTPTAYSTLGLTFFYIRAQLPGATQHHYLPILLSAN
jgi:hypothetical protein